MILQIRVLLYKLGHLRLINETFYYFLGFAPQSVGIGPQFRRGTCGVFICEWLLLSLNVFFCGGSILQIFQFDFGNIGCRFFCSIWAIDDKMGDGFHLADILLAFLEEVALVIL